MQYSRIQSSISTQESQIQNKLSKYDSQIYACERTISGLTTERENGIIRLSELYYPDFAAKTIKDGLPQVQRQLQKIIERKQEARLDFEATMNQESTAYKAALKSHEVATDVLATLREDVVQATKLYEAQVQSNEEYRAIMANDKRLGDRIELAKGRKSQLESLAQEKVPAFEADALFSYLQNRNYATPEYLGSGLTRRLDDMLARAINFVDEKRKFDYLTTMPGRLEVAIGEIAQQQSKIQASAQTVARTIADKVELPNARKKYKQQETTVEVLRLSAESHNEKYIAAQNAHRQLDSKGDTFYAEAVSSVKSFLKDSSIEELKIMARKTPGTADDKAVDRLEEIDVEIRQQKDEIKSYRTERSKVEIKLDAIKEFNSKMRREYGSRDGTFSSSFDTDDMIRLILLNQLTTSDAVRRADRHWSDTPRPTHSYSSSSDSSWSSSSHSSSSDSFSSGGGFGGGGSFSSGNGF